MFAHGRGGGIEEDRFAAFGILQLQHRHRRQFELGLVTDPDCDEIVSGVKDLHRLFIRIVIQKIADHEDDCAFFQIPDQGIHRGADSGPPRLRLEGEKLADQTQNMRSAGTRWKPQLGFVGEDKQTDLVVVADCTERKKRSGFRDFIVLGRFAGTEEHRSGGVDRDNDGQLAFLRIFLDIRSAHAGGDVPVDIAHIVLRGVLPHLAELDPAALEDAVIGASGKLFHELPGLDLDFPDFGYQIPCQHSLFLSFEDSGNSTGRIRGF